MNFELGFDFCLPAEVRRSRTKVGYLSFELLTINFLISLYSMKKDYNIEFSKGFTLIELLVTVAVLGLLVGGILMSLDIGSIFGKASLTKAKKFAATLERGELLLSQVGKWSFEEGSSGTCPDGKDACDTSGYGNNGTLTCIGPGCTLPTWQTKDQCGLGLGGCLSFGGNGYVNVGDKPSLKITSPPITLTAWIKKNSGDSYEIVTKGSVAQVVAQEGYGILVLSDGRIVLGNNPHFLESNTAIKTGQWYHIVGVINGPNSKIYINGTLDEATGNVAVSSTSIPLTIGAACSDTSCNNVSLFFNGLIDEVAIYSKALTASQIQHLYAQGFIKRAMALK